MTSAIWEGALVGLSTLLFIGPVLFSLLESGMKSGKTGGIAVATGIFVSDVLCVAICYLTAAKSIEDISNPTWVAICGGLILAFMGLRFLLKKEFGIREYQPQRLEAMKAFTTGFLVNFVNPFVFIFWLGFIAFAQLRYQSDKHVFIFLTSAILVIYITDLLKGIFASKLRQLMDDQWLRIAYRIIGTVLLLFSIRLFVFALS